MTNNALSILAGSCLALAAAGGCRREEPAPAPAPKPAAVQPEMVKLAVSKDAEAGCALCIYHMEEAKGCVLAVKIDDKAYLVDGKTMEDVGGDPHAADGLCNVGRAVHVEGHIEGDRFAATKIELKPKP